MLFAREPITQDFMNEALPLFLAHHKEISFFSNRKLDIDFQQYLLLENAGVMRLFTARDNGVLCGYCIFVITSHMHYKDLLTASQTALFIPKDRRGFGVSFLKFCNEQLKEDGIHAVIQRVTKQMDYSPILIRDGFECMEVVYTKMLGVGDG